MSELAGWPYAPLPSAFDTRVGQMRYIVQYTEDGCYGFAFRGHLTVLQMVGPCLTKFICQERLLQALTGGEAGVE